MAKKRSQKIVEHKPGYVSDLSDTLNPGYSTFKNVYIDAAGKLHKRKGWTDPAYFYGSMGNVQSRIFGPDTGVPPLLTDTRFRPNNIFLQTSTESGTQYADYFFSRNDSFTGGVTKLWHTRLLNGGYVNGKAISDTTNFIFDGTEYVQYIPTIDHIYIINGKSGRTVRKYKPSYVNTWDLALPNRYAAKEEAHNLMIANGSHSGENFLELQNQTVSADTAHTYTITEVLDVAARIGTWFTVGLQTGTQTQTDDDGWTYHPNGTRSKVVTTTAVNPYAAGTCFYTFLPVYNTGAFGNINTNAYISSTLPEHGSHKIDILLSWIEASNYNPYVIGWNLYKTHYQTEKTQPDATIPWYFMTYIPKSAVTIDGINNEFLFTDTFENDGLTVPFINPNWITCVSGNNNDGDVFKEGFGINATCGCYTQQRLILGGDNVYPNQLYISEIDMTDAFDPEKVLLINEATANNPIVSIQAVGDNIAVFTKTSITLMRSTDNINVPFALQKLTTTIGCDNVGGACVVNGVCFFIHNKNLYAINQNGQINIVSSNVNSQIELASGDILVKENPNDMTVRLFFTETDGTVRNLVFYTQFNMWSEESGYQDTYTKAGTIFAAKTVLTLNTKQDEFRLLGYHYDAVSKTEVGITRQGLVVARSSASDYDDNSGMQDNGYQWDDYVYYAHFTDGAVPVETYNVAAEIVRPLFFGTRVTLNAIIIYGSGNIKYSISTDGRAYSTAKTITASKYGYTIPLNEQGQLFNIKIIDDNNADIDYDYIELIYTAEANVSVRINSGAGS